MAAMSTPGEKLILRLLSQSVEHVNKTCDLGTQVNDDPKVNDDSANINSIEKSDDGRENNFSGALKGSNTKERSQKVTKKVNKKVIIKKLTKLKNKSEDVPNHNFLDIGTSTNSEKTVDNLKLSQYSKKSNIKLFTQAEVGIMLKAIKKQGDNVNHREIAKQLGRKSSTVFYKIKKLKHDYSGPKRGFTLIEDKIVMDAYLKRLVSGQKFRFMENIPMSELRRLSLDMKRNYDSIFRHWKFCLQPWILQYFSGTLNLQVVPMLTQFLLDNYSGVDSIDWSVVASKPEFAGHTESSRRCLFFTNRRHLKENIKFDEDDLLLVHKYTDQKLKEGKFRKISNQIETRQMDIVKYFQEYVDQNNITDIFE